MLFFKKSCRRLNGVFQKLLIFKLKVQDEKELLKMNQLAKDAGLVTAMITDAGRTVIAPGTKTCLGVGPADEGELDALFSGLKLF